jgi:hypothetical protein
VEEAQKERDCIGGVGLVLDTNNYALPWLWCAEKGASTWPLSAQQDLLLQMMPPAGDCRMHAHRNPGAEDGGRASQRRGSSDS